MTDGFGQRLQGVFDTRGRMCLGIDPHPWLLEAWGLDDSGAGVREFGLRAVDAAAGRIGVVKPQIAFFERHGAAGYAALERVFAEARDAGLLVIADAKRGDIGSTVDAYADAWLGDESPLRADAMTIYAYQGLGSIAGVMERADAAGRGLFVVAATSNPEAAAIQQAVLQRSSRAGERVAGALVAGIAAWNAEREGAAEQRLGPIGAVIGATIDPRDFGIDTNEAPRPGLPVLVPGIGFQGGELAEVPARLGALAAGALLTDSRQVLQAGPDGLADAIARRADEIGALDV
ncbi:orotidine-5'-phosphate decarboxylase [Agromyces archimandritae]|uniref:Orotidine-5'-phosphate decarboxylase n=1 Tax=Agromyces archimandritae TaxID=2781962 RepID=A0A975FMW5_9MICO|nr:orotidine-5'-phosphate decarboxylase [Agromyces archimandritae]QTX04622.1 orotidine-5'-phosphate decarboxylase [Agromyces archimandritae]